MHRCRFGFAILPFLLIGCPKDEPIEPPAPAAAVFDLSADLATTDGFYSMPYPSDTRLTDDGHPDLRGLPLPPANTFIPPLRATAMQANAFPVVPVGYFAFTAPLAERDEHDVIPADPTSPILLIDIDEDSPDRGALYPVVSHVPDHDAYLTRDMLEIAPRPGIVLIPHRTYAFVVTTRVLDANANPIEPAPAIEAMAAGALPDGPNATELRDTFAPLWTTLQMQGIDVTTVATATVFTTGDVVEELQILVNALAERHSTVIEDLHVDPDDGAAHPDYCELVGEMTVPQFQHGTPPFDTEGLFDDDDGGLPSVQRQETIPLTLTIPNGEMPDAGFPLVVYFHGSGGIHTAIVDRGLWRPESDPNNCPEQTTNEWEGVAGCNTKGGGPAAVLAPYGFAMAGSALPVNPDRLPGASETAYLNFANLSAGRDLFRQGVIEQRLFVDALETLEISPATVAACTGVTLPVGQTAFRFDMMHFYTQGQSMGGQYVNLFSAIEPRVLAGLPTGSGGYWSHFILETPLYPNIDVLIGRGLLGTSAHMTFMHPALFLFETVWEPVDPMIYMPRLARRPLPGQHAVSTYKPVALGDSYFETPTYDAMSLAYGHPQAGDIVWPSMQEALALEGQDGLVSYPITNNLTSANGSMYTSAVVQYMGDGVYDPHAIYTQLDVVRHQYACFLATHLETGTATIVAPNPVGSPCE